MSRDARDAVIETLTLSEAELLERVLFGYCERREQAERLA